MREPRVCLPGFEPSPPLRRTLFHPPQQPRRRDEQDAPADQRHDADADGKARPEPARGRRRVRGLTVRLRAGGIQRRVDPRAASACGVRLGGVGLGRACATGRCRRRFRRRFRLGRYRGLRGLGVLPGLRPAGAAGALLVGGGAGAVVARRALRLRLRRRLRSGCRSWLRGRGLRGGRLRLLRRCCRCRGRARQGPRLRAAAAVAAVVLFACERRKRVAGFFSSFSSERMPSAIAPGSVSLPLPALFNT